VIEHGMDKLAGFIHDVRAQVSKTVHLSEPIARAAQEDRYIVVGVLAGIAARAIRIRRHAQSGPQKCYRVRRGSASESTHLRMATLDDVVLFSTIAYQKAYQGSRGASPEASLPSSAHCRLNPS
jgi:hypothetical protein